MHLPDLFTIVRRGDVTIVVPSDRLEEFDSSYLEEAAAVVVLPLKDQELPLLLVDLSRVDYFGSSFLTLLLRCWKVVLVKGGQMVLSGVSDRARELLHITALDIVWPLYATRAEALEALEAE